MDRKEGCVKPAPMPDGKMPKKSTGQVETNPTYTTPESKMPRNMR